MKKFFLTVFSMMTVAGSAWAGCNPCICGGGGGLPPPPDCGKFAGHQKNQIMDLLSQASVQEDLESRGGLTKIQSFQSETSVIYHFTTGHGDVLASPELPLEVR